MSALPSTSAFSTTTTRYDTYITANTAKHHLVFHVPSYNHLHSFISSRILLPNKQNRWISGGVLGQQTGHFSLKQRICDKPRSLTPDVQEPHSFQQLPHKSPRGQGRKPSPSQQNTCRLDWRTQPTLQCTGTGKGLLHGSQSGPHGYTELIILPGNLSTLFALHNFSPNSFL